MVVCGGVSQSCSSYKYIDASSTAISKRKAEYGRVDRATYKSKNRKNNAKKSAQSKWESVRHQFASLMDVTNTSKQTRSKFIDLDNLGTGWMKFQATACNVVACVCWKVKQCTMVWQQCCKNVKTADGHQRWVVNLTAVLGQMSLGASATSFTCIMAPMNVPGMPKRLYAATETFCEWQCKRPTHWEVTCSRRWGEDERKLAIERGISPGCSSYHSSSRWRVVGMVP